MIIWINGAFGGGKTTLVTELHRRFPQTLVFDPEAVGDVLRSIVEPPTGDFQDLPLWRSAVASIASGLVTQYRRTVLVPMTLMNPKYVTEIFGAIEGSGVRVHHFFLRVPAETLARRIDERTENPDDPARDEASRAWCKQQIKPCIEKARLLPAETVFLDGEKPTAVLADEVRARVGSLCRPEGR